MQNGRPKTTEGERSPPDHQGLRLLQKRERSGELDTTCNTEFTRPILQRKWVWLAELDGDKERDGEQWEIVKKTNMRRLRVQLLGVQILQYYIEVFGLGVEILQGCWTPRGPLISERGQTLQHYSEVIWLGAPNTCTLLKNNSRNEYGTTNTCKKKNHRNLAIYKQLLQNQEASESSIVEHAHAFHTWDMIP